MRSPSMLGFCIFICHTGRMGAIPDPLPIRRIGLPVLLMIDLRVGIDLHKGFIIKRQQENMCLTLDL